MKHLLVYQLQVYINIFIHTQHLLCNPFLYTYRFLYIFAFLYNSLMMAHIYGRI